MHLVMITDKMDITYVRVVRVHKARSYSRPLCSFDRMCSFDTLIHNFLESMIPTRLATLVMSYIAIDPKEDSVRRCRRY